MQRILLKSVSILIVLFLMISLTGCDEIKKIIYKGTVKGVNLCIKQNSSLPLQEYLIKRKCEKEHQSVLKFKQLDAAADIVILDNGTGWISITNGTNLYYNYVITELLVDIIVYDAGGKLHVKPTNIVTWVEPLKDLLGSNRIRKIDLPANTSSDEINEKYCSEKIKKSCKNWSIKRITGIKM